MTADEFKKRWAENGEALCPFPRKSLQDLNLLSSTTLFLETAGLPADAAPFLSFEYPDNPHGCNLKRLTEVINREPHSDYACFIFIGNTSNGDPIVIDTTNNDQILFLDHESLYLSPAFFNTSIESLAECLLIYRGFGETVAKEVGEEAFPYFNFSDEHFNDLKQMLYSADSAIVFGGFWQDELEELLVNRQWERDNK